jgi:transposase-like protein
MIFDKSKLLIKNARSLRPRLQKVIFQQSVISPKEWEMIICPKCGGSQRVKNGFSYDEKQNFKCKACGRQFVENGQQNQISVETKQRIDKLLLEKYHWWV